MKGIRIAFEVEQELYDTALRVLSENLQKSQGDVARGLLFFSGRRFGLYLERFIDSKADREELHELMLAILHSKQEK